MEGEAGVWSSPRYLNLSISDYFDDCDVSDAVKIMPLLCSGWF